ncbi:hypothetical protein K3495_g9982 [Podosphaera aphanis]|nr:hypothetical protein K3495_g9982 [Podosphaera aphanis]
MPGRKKYRDASKNPSEKPRKCLSHEQRIQIFTLRTSGAQSYTQISDALKISRSTVRAVLKSGVTTPKKPQGRISKKIKPEPKA